MLKFPAVFSVPVFSSVSKTLNAFSVNFRDKRTKENFIILCTSIIHSGSTLFSQAVKISSCPKDITKALSHFLQSSSWSTEVLDKMRLSLIKRRLTKKIQLLVIDFTALVKTGKNFEYLSFVHDGRDDQIKPGYALLLALSITEDNLKLPIHHRLVNYQHNFRSENLEICQFLDDLVRLDLAKNELKKAIFLFDRGFDRKIIVSKLLSLHLSFVVQAKKKIVVLEDGKELLLSKLKNGFYQNVLIKVWGLKLNMKVDRRWHKKEKSFIKSVYLTNLDENQFSITKVYRQRWKIEEAIKELKQSYGLEKFRVRKWQAIQRMVSLCLFCSTLVTLTTSQHYSLLKQILKSIQSLIHRSRIFKSKTVELLRNIAQILTNFALISQIKFILATDYG